MGRIIKGMLGVVLVLVLVVVVGWIGVTVYSCVTDRATTGRPDMPQADEAAYSIYIKNTGNLILTDDYEVHGSEVGSRVFVLRGFWELTGQDFVYKDGELVLDEGIFGIITIKRRER